MQSSQARLAIDIGGTFTDVALEVDRRIHTVKVLTRYGTSAAVMRAIDQVLATSGVEVSAVGTLIHGTTFVTNTMIERKGACTALITTAGFRDAVEIGYEHRFEQYDIFINKPQPLVPRYRRLEVDERISARGTVLLELDESSVQRLIPILQQQGIESVAIGLIHSYANAQHERRIASILRAKMPKLWISLSSEVCPEVREYERLSTTCANAYVQPQMAGYLLQLQDALTAHGFRCPLHLMMSDGGLTTLDTAIRFPIRLLESGPAGGAILASCIANERDIPQALSYDMGGTTAKICIVDDGEAQTSRSFEVDRQYRFTKGSGLPLRIPVIDMVEIGAGGGSIARVDAMQRLQVGPQSAASNPGPACYNRGGTQPTVTDADVVLGRLNPQGFAGGEVTLEPAYANAALRRVLGDILKMPPSLLAFAVSELVDDNMANAARVHAVERGKELSERVLIAFGGAAPLHACRIAEKLRMRRIIIPVGAGVGSAIGFLQAPMRFDIVRSHYCYLDHFNACGINTLFTEMRAEAVQSIADDGSLEEQRIAYMRYVGQGHEIVVDLPKRLLVDADASTLKALFDAAYEKHFGRTIPAMTVEILTFSLILTKPQENVPRGLQTVAKVASPKADEMRLVFDPTRLEDIQYAVYRRADLPPGTQLSGPAVITEEQTTTIVNRGFELSVGATGYLDLVRI